jgi:hypothetical protein
MNTKMEFTEDMHTKLLEKLGLKPSVIKDGKVFMYVPVDPVALIVWANLECARPIFKDGVLTHWSIATTEERMTIKQIVEEVSRDNGFHWEGLTDVFENEDACKLAVLMAATSMEK